MTRFIQFYEGEREALGSDGCQTVDGRLAMHSVIMEAARRARRLRGVGKRYTGFKVLEGKRPVTGMIEIKVL